MLICSNHVKTSEFYFRIAYENGQKTKEFFSCAAYRNRKDCENEIIQKRAHFLQITQNSKSTDYSLAEVNNVLSYDK